MSQSYLLVPPVSFRFKVERADKTGNETSFKSVSGLEATVETEAIKAGGVNDCTFQVPTGVKYSDLVLSRGMLTKDSIFTEWLFENIDETSGKIKKHNLIISLTNGKDPIAIWVVVDAYPISWKVADLNSQDNNVLIEELKLAYKKFVLVKSS